MKKAKKLLAIILLVVMTLSVLTACGKTETPAEPTGGEAAAPEAAEETAGKRTLTVGLMQESNGFDPAESFGTMIPMSLVYDTIVRRDVNGELKPYLATDWEWLDDTTVRFTFRDDVYFTNGRKMDCNDVLFSMHHFLEGSQTYATDSKYDNVDFDNSTVDGNVLTIKLYQPDATFIENMATFRWSTIIPVELAEMTEEEIWGEPIGSGPYICTENVSGSYATFVRNENYWGEAPEADEIIVRYYTEENTMMIDFETGNLDIIVDLSDNNVNRINNGEAPGQAIVYNTGDMIFFSMPEYVECFEDIRVRQAVAHALDAETLTKVALGSLGVPATSTVPATTLFYKNVGAYTYDPDLSRQLLTEAGYSEGELSFKIVYVNSDANTRMVEAVQSMLADVGINLEVYGYDLSTAMTYFMAGDLDFSLGEHTDNCYDPSIAYSDASQMCSNTATALTDVQLNELINEGEIVLDESEREKIYADIQDYMYDLCRWIPISEKMVAAAVSDSIDADSYYAFEGTFPDLRYITFK